MRQRVMIAMALALDPKVLIADEPTTALDVTVQAQIMDLLADLRRDLNMAMILITHDLGVVAGVADRIAVMYAGRIVEHADVRSLYKAPAHPYTKGLLESIPRMDVRGQELSTIKGLPPNLMRIPSGCPFHPGARTCSRSAWTWCRTTWSSATAGPALATSRRRSVMTAPTSSTKVRGETILSVDNLVKHFPITQGVLFQRQIGAVKAVDGVSFELRRGETLGVVGESGCGKSTLARLLMRLETPTSGRATLEGKDLFKASGGELRGCAATCRW
ncbi:hypothetical protein GCM10027614_59470 [Micromonospora vulcania]